MMQEQKSAIEEFKKKLEKLKAEEDKKYTEIKKSKNHK